MVVIKLNCSLCHICAICSICTICTVCAICTFVPYVLMCHICTICTICAISVPAAFVKIATLQPLHLICAQLQLWFWWLGKCKCWQRWEMQKSIPRWNLRNGVLGHRVKAWLFRRDWLKRRGWWKQETCVQSPPNQRSVAAKNQPQKIKSQKINCAQKFWAVVLHNKRILLNCFHFPPTPTAPGYCVGVGMQWRTWFLV